MQKKLSTLHLCLIIQTDNDEKKIIYILQSQMPLTLKQQKNENLRRLQSYFPSVQLDGTECRQPRWLGWSAQSIPRTAIGSGRSWALTSRRERRRESVWEMKPLPKI